MNTPRILVDNLYQSFGADYATYMICPNTHNILYCITDGHSQRNGSAELVKLFSTFLKSKISLDTLDETNIEMIINQHLAEFSESIKRKLPRAAMCFLLVAKIERNLHIFYLGDCRLGKLNARNEIEWLTQPHSLILQKTPGMTEEELRLSEFNHQIFKQFRTIRPSKPDYLKFDLSDSKYILATDGFWKLLPEKQYQILIGNQVSLEDDVAFLIFE